MNVNNYKDLDLIKYTAVLSFLIFFNYFLWSINSWEIIKSINFIFLLFVVFDKSNCPTNNKMAILDKCMYPLVPYLLRISHGPGFVICSTNAICPTNNKIGKMEQIDDP